MKFTNPTPIPFLFFFNMSSVSDTPLQHLNLHCLAGPAREKRLDGERKENGLNLPHATFVVLLFLGSLLQCWTAHPIYRLKGMWEVILRTWKWNVTEANDLSAVCELVSIGWRPCRLVGRSLQSSHSSSWKFFWRSQITLLQEANQPALIRAP